MLATMQLSLALPEGIGSHQVMFIGGMIGVILMRLPLHGLLSRLRNLGWVGIKLVVIVLAHEDIGFT